MPTSSKSFVLLAALFVFAWSPLAAQSPVALVLEVEGTWRVNGGEQARAGQMLTAGSTIIRISSAASDLIKIGRTTGGPIDDASRVCSQRSCAGTIVIPPGSEPTTLAGRVAAGVAGYLSRVLQGSAPRRVPHENRGNFLKDGVVELGKDGSADLSTVLDPAGEQYLSWRQYVPEGKSGEWSDPVRVKAPAAVAGLKPGLYELQLSRRVGSGFEPLASSLILASEADKFVELSPLFAAQKAHTQSWGNDVRSATKRLYLMLSLEYLANESFTR